MGYTLLLPKVISGNWFPVARSRPSRAARLRRPAAQPARRAFGSVNIGKLHATKESFAAKYYFPLSD
jgi:hypothetical protein